MGFTFVGINKPLSSFLETEIKTLLFKEHSRKETAKFFKGEYQKATDDCDKNLVSLTNAMITNNRPVIVLTRKIFKVIVETDQNWFDEPRKLNSHHYGVFLGRLADLEKDGIIEVVHMFTDKAPMIIRLIQPELRTMMTCTVDQEAKMLADCEAFRANRLPKINKDTTQANANESNDESVEIPVESVQEQEEKIWPWRNPETGHVFNNPKHWENYLLIIKMQENKEIKDPSDPQKVKLFEELITEPYALKKDAPAFGQSSWFNNCSVNIRKPEMLIRVDDDTGEEILINPDDLKEDCIEIGCPSPIDLMTEAEREEYGIVDKEE